MKRYDAIIIGGGHNGLTSAAYLARAGKSVLVLERREALGGACVTEEVWPGYRISAAAYLCSLLHPRIIADLELPKYGFEVYRRETSGFAPFPDGSWLMLYPDAARTRAEIQRFAPKDAEAYFAFEEETVRAAEILEPFLLGPAPTMGQVAGAFAAAGAPELFEPYFTGSVRALLERKFTDDRLMAVLATDGLIGTCAGVSDPGTAYVLLHHYLGMALGERGLWGYVRGGMGRISEAIAASARAHGADIRSGAAVVRILMENDRAVGVAQENGDTYYADAIFSNAHPATTYGMLEGSAPTDAAAALAGYRSEGVSCKINFAVSELPDFGPLTPNNGGTGPLTPNKGGTGGGTAARAEHLGTVHLCESLDLLERAWEDCRYGRPSREPMVEIYIQTATDPSLAPAGRHILSCFTQYFPYSLAGGLAADAEAEAYADRVVEVIARYAPNVVASIEARQVLTPQRLEERFGLIGGHIFHGDITPDQMFGGRLGHRGAATEVPGLYLCGSGAWPGGCVSGMPGYNAAHSLLTSNT